MILWDVMMLGGGCGLEIDVLDFGFIYVQIEDGKIEKSQLRAIFILFYEFQVAQLKYDACECGKPASSKMLN